MNKTSYRSIIAVVALSAAITTAADSFLQPGDRWVLTGDSITHYDIYRQQVERVLQHFHPEAGITILPGGIPGGTSAAQQDVKDKAPTIVSVMLGMNNYINSNVRYGADTSAALGGYRQDMEAKIVACRAAGAAVLLLSPTLVDLRFEHGIFELRGGVVFLQQCAAILRELAAANDDVFYLPVQEEAEALEQSLGRGQILRHDGVHPSALGQYQIARTLWERLGVAGPLAKGRRALAEAPVPVPVKVALKQRRLGAPSDGVAFRFTATEPCTVTATWSLRAARGTVDLKLPAGETEWKPAIPPAALQFDLGQQETLVLDLAAGAKRSLYLLDFSCVPVIHTTDGVAEGELLTEAARPEGKRVANWRVERRNRGLLFSGEILDSEIRADGFWPWQRDGVNLYLDLRPDDHQGDISFDEDVHITILTPHEDPAFGASLIPWVGRGMHLAADSGMERTATGYRWHLYIHRYFTKANPVDFSKQRSIGFNLVVPDQDTVGEQGRTQYHRAWELTPYVDKYPNLLPLLDLSGEEKADQAVRLHIFGG